MKATELRHGNLVEYNGIMWVVLSITYPSPRNDNYSDKWLLELSNGGIITVTLDECNPILLTYKWLESVKGDGSFRLRFNKSIAAFEVERKYTSLDGEEWIFISNCRYIHEWQNLYFALTGEEL